MPAPRSRRRPPAAHRRREPDRAGARARARDHRARGPDRRPPGARGARRLRRHRGPRGPGLRRLRDRAPASEGRGSAARDPLRRRRGAARAQPARADRRRAARARAGRERAGRRLPRARARVPAPRRQRGRAARDRRARSPRARGRERLPLDELSEQVREAVREFAEREVAPRGRADPSPRRAGPGVLHHQDGRARLLRAGGARGLRRLGARQPRHDPHHRGALARVARGGGLADHAARDPDQGAAPGRQRGAEEALAAADRRRRDHGRDLRHRARRGQRRGLGQVPRRAPAAGRPRRLGDQRPEVLVHLRGPRERARPARAHRPRPGEGRQGALALHRPEGQPSTATPSR